MEFYDVIEARRSVRGYLDKNVPDEAIAKISRKETVFAIASEIC